MAPVKRSVDAMAVVALVVLALVSSTFQPCQAAVDTPKYDIAECMQFFPCIRLEFCHAQCQLSDHARRFHAYCRNIHTCCCIPY